MTSQLTGFTLPVYRQAAAQTGGGVLNFQDCPGDLPNPLGHVFSIPLSLLFLSRSAPLAEGVLEALDSIIVVDLVRAEDWTHALELLREEPFDAVLVDSQCLPDGLASLTELKRRAPWSALVVLTEDHDHQTGLAALRHGAHDHLCLSEFEHGQLYRIVRYSVERLKSERTLQQSQQQFYQSQKMEAIGRVSAGMTHDFRNLIAVILNNCQILLKLTQEPRVRTSVEEISLAGNKASNLVSQLLQFVRDEPAEVRRVTLSDLLPHLKVLITPLLGKNIQLHWQVTEDRVEVEVNPTQLEQVIMNLVVNSVDALPEGRGHIGVEARRLDLSRRYTGRGLTLAAGSYLALTVWDTGAGIPPEIIPHLYEPFFTTKSKGTGLGLSTVYSLTRSMDGEVGVATRQGVGTAFRVFLPCRGRSEPPPQLPATVLLLDGHTLERQALRELLEELGAQVLEARTPREAFRVLCSKQKLDWVLADLYTLDGDIGAPLQTCREHRPEARLALVSMFPAAFHDPAGWDTHGLPVLEKPVSYGALRELLQPQASLPSSP